MGTPKLLVNGNDVTRTRDLKIMGVELNVPSLYTTTIEVPYNQQDIDISALFTGITPTYKNREILIHMGYRDHEQVFNAPNFTAATAAFKQYIGKRVSVSIPEIVTPDTLGKNKAYTGRMYLQDVRLSGSGVVLYTVVMRGGPFWTTSYMTQGRIIDNTDGDGAALISVLSTTGTTVSDQHGNTVVVAGSPSPRFLPLIYVAPGELASLSSTDKAASFLFTKRFI